MSRANQWWAHDFVWVGLHTFRCSSNFRAKNAKSKSYKIYWIFFHFCVYVNKNNKNKSANQIQNGCRKNTRFAKKCQLTFHRVYRVRQQKPNTHFYQLRQICCSYGFVLNTILKLKSRTTNYVHTRTQTDVVFKNCVQVNKNVKNQKKYYRICMYLIS